MLEQETSQILQTLTARSIGPREAATLGEILASDLPRGVKSYLRTEVQQWLFDDLMRAPHFSRLQTSDPAVKRHRDVFVRSLSTQYVFTRDQFLTTLQHAVLFTLNYLCRPHRTLRSFLFTPERTVTVDTIRAKAGFVADYQYLYSILDRVFQQRRMLEISEEEFSAILLEIDTHVSKEHTPRELARLARPIFDFLLLRNAPLDAPIPLRPVLAFFEDKGMNDICDYIEKVSHIRSRSDISLKGLAELLEDMLTPAAPRTSTLSLYKEPEATMAVRSPVVEQEPAVTAAEDQPSPAVLHPESADLQPASEEPSGVPDGSSPVPSEVLFGDIREVISAEQRQRFIRTICGKDEAFYEALVLKFNSMKQWSDASEYLRDIFAIHGIDPFSAVAVELTDVIQQRFSGKDKGNV